MFDPALIDAIHRATEELGQPDTVAVKIVAWLKNHRNSTTETDNKRHFELICEELRLETAE